MGTKVFKVTSKIKEKTTLRLSDWLIRLVEHDSSQRFTIAELHKYVELVIALDALVISNDIRVLNLAHDPKFFLQSIQQRKLEDYHLLTSFSGILITLTAHSFWFGVPKLTAP